MFVMRIKNMHCIRRSRIHSMGMFVTDVEQDECPYDAM